MLIEIPDYWVPAGYRLTGRMVHCEPIEDDDQTTLVLAGPKKVCLARDCCSSLPEVERVRKQVGVVLRLTGETRPARCNEWYLIGGVPYRWTESFPTNTAYPILHGPTPLYE